MTPCKISAPKARNSFSLDLVRAVMESNNRISIQFMTIWLGIPYCAYGSDRDRGIDCLQLIKQFYEYIGKDIVIPDEYAFDTLLRTSKIRKFKESEHWQVLKEKDKNIHDTVIVGDTHLGVMLTDKIYIHSNVIRRKVILSDLEGDLGCQDYFFARPA